MTYKNLKRAANMILKFPCYHIKHPKRCTVQVTIWNAHQIARTYVLNIQFMQHKSCNVYINTWKAIYNSASNENRYRISHSDCLSVYLVHSSLNYRQYAVAAMQPVSPFAVVPVSRWLRVLDFSSLVPVFHLRSHLFLAQLIWFTSLQRVESVIRLLCVCVEFFN